MTQEFYMKDEDDVLRISRDSFKITLKLKGIASRLSVNDVKKCNKCIRTMFTPYIYLKYLHDLLDVLEAEVITNTSRYYKLKPVIRKEIDKYE